MVSDVVFGGGLQIVFRFYLCCLSVGLFWLMVLLLLWVFSGVVDCSVALFFTVCGVLDWAIGLLFGFGGWFKLLGWVGL